MTAIRRRRLIRIAIRTVLLTILALVLELGGSLDRLEHNLYDLRARYCQQHLPLPTDRLVQMDIDDNAMSQIGRFPWERDKLAEMIDEIGQAGPKVLAMDILFAETSELAYDSTGHRIDRDAILGESIRKLRVGLTPCSMTFFVPTDDSPLDRELMPMLIDNLELTPEQCAERLRSHGFLSSDLVARVALRYLTVLPQAIYQRIYRELAAAGAAGGSVISKDALKHKVFPHANPETVGSVRERLYDDEIYDKVMREVALNRFTLDVRPGLAAVLPAADETTPILPISKAAAFSAFVDYLPDEDGKVRRVPLISSFRGRLVPHMGLATACAMLDVDIHDIRLGTDSITIPRRNKPDIVIPVSTETETRFGPIGYLMELPIVDRRGSWHTEAGVEPPPDAVKHVSIYEAWRICLTRHRIAANEKAADYVLVHHVLDADGNPTAALTGALALTDPAAAASYDAKPLTGAAKRKLMKDTIDTMKKLKDGLLASDPKDLDNDDKTLLKNLTLSGGELGEVIKQNDAMLRQLADFQAQLKDKLNGRAIFLGGTGTGHVDVVPTSIHVACPGVVVHGAIFNAILTGKMWRVAPRYWAFVIIAFIGLLTGIFASVLPPFKAFLATAALALGYLIFNGYYLFAYKNIILGGAGAAGPLLAAALVWSGDTLISYITERAERSRITKRFRNYVDPSLVDYVIEHPELTRFDGDAREMTMGFTDLAGFTTLTESLGTRTVQLLSEYMDIMLPIIRKNGGYVSRLMGDGIYFFFNGIAADPEHAAHAVSAVLAMHKAMDAFNLTLPSRNFPTLGMRAGICSGRVIVGDAGSKDFNDYTAVGDSVNTAARLETANKVFATKALINARAVELLNGQYLVRPIANLRVAGKTKGIFVFEPLCKAEEATDVQKQIAELSAAITGAFQRGDFAGCIEACDKLDQTFGPAKFTKLYRDISLDYQVERPGDFDGQVILTEK
jgi:CHASE2 domain-containing sensor protein/class 3 adenylate cyclase